MERMQQTQLQTEFLPGDEGVVMDVAALPGQPPLQEMAQRRATSTKMDETYETGTNRGKIRNEGQRRIESPRRSGKGRVD